MSSPFYPTKPYYTGSKDSHGKDHSVWFSLFGNTRKFQDFKICCQGKMPALLILDLLPNRGLPWTPNQVSNPPEWFKRYQNLSQEAIEEQCGLDIGKWASYAFLQPKLYEKGFSYLSREEKKPFDRGHASAANAALSTREDKERSEPVQLSVALSNNRTELDHGRYCASWEHRRLRGLVPEKWTQPRFGITERLPSRERVSLGWEVVMFLSTRCT
ncbi:hypothetical protein N7456_006823 [Penicillium angulare]|uniref:Uncharacterized protein n=1 Tax=Penicillium angulare TaxID=116970 RepID=A0A9W9KCJ5_9EURO|nr:hypothetical protein N7456_006823 [Penicillium angulare]